MREGGREIICVFPPSQIDARQLNHREVVEEDRRNKLPANWEARQRRVEWEEQDEKARQVSDV